eukprot:1087918-Lingulodinium_polyedra.AAC.1
MGRPGGWRQSAAPWPRHSGHATRVLAGPTRTRGDNPAGPDCWAASGCLRPTTAGRVENPAALRDRN